MKTEIKNVKEILKKINNGLTNQIENAKLRNDDYDVGYLTSMKNHLAEAMKSLASLAK